MFRGKTGRLAVAGKSAAKRPASVGVKSQKATVRKTTARRATTRKSVEPKTFVASPYRKKGYQVTLKEGGRPEFVKVPYKHYLRLIGADKSDERLAAEALARNEETFPADIVERIVIDGDNPIKVYRKYRGLTQMQLAEQVSINAVYLSQIERGDRQGSTKTLIALAQALRVDLDDLVRD